MNDSPVQLEASRPVIKDLFRDLLIEMKGFKYQITMKVLLSKQKENDDREFTTVYFNSTAKRVINLNNCGLNKSFQPVLYRLDNWINEGSAWITKYIDGEYVNISIYSPLSESTYIELPDELRNSMKGLINIKNDDNKCFLWCHARNFIKLNPLNKNPQRITKVDKTLANNLDYKDIKFLYLKSIIKRLNKRIIFPLMYFVMKII